MQSDQTSDQNANTPQITSARAFQHHSSQNPNYNLPPLAMPAGQQVLLYGVYQPQTSPYIYTIPDSANIPLTQAQSNIQPSLYALQYPHHPVVQHSTPLSGTQVYPYPQLVTPLPIPSAAQQMQQVVTPSLSRTTSSATMATSTSAAANNHPGSQVLLLQQLQQSPPHPNQNILQKAAPTPSFNNSTNSSSYALSQSQQPQIFNNQSYPPAQVKPLYQMDPLLHQQLQPQQQAMHHHSMGVQQLQQQQLPQTGPASHLPLTPVYQPISNSDAEWQKKFGSDSRSSMMHNYQSIAPTQSQHHPYQQQQQQQQLLTIQTYQSPVVTLVFHVKCETMFKQEVAVVGSVPCLGGWDVTKAFKLHTQKDQYPVWSGKVEYICQEQSASGSEGESGAQDQIQYKYIVMMEEGEIGSTQVEWEVIPQNRSIITKNRAQVTLHEVFSDASQRKEDIIKLKMVSQPYLPSALSSVFSPLQSQQQELVLSSVNFDRQQLQPQQRSSNNDKLIDQMLVMSQPAIQEQVNEREQDQFKYNAVSQLKKEGTVCSFGQELNKQSMLSLQGSQSYAPLPTFNQQNQIELYQKTNENDTKESESKAEVLSVHIQNESQKATSDKTLTYTPLQASSIVTTPAKFDSHFEPRHSTASQGQYPKTPILKNGTTRRTTYANQEKKTKELSFVSDISSVIMHKSDHDGLVLSAQNATNSEQCATSIQQNGNLRILDASKKSFDLPLQMPTQTNTFIEDNTTGNYIQEKQQQIFLSNQNQQSVLGLTHPHAAIQQKPLSRRKRLINQLFQAFPIEMKQLMQQKHSMSRGAKSFNLNQSYASNASGTDEAHGLLAHHQHQSLPSAKKIPFDKMASGIMAQNRENVEIDPTQCVIQCTYMLPYKLTSTKPGIFIAETAYQSPILLFGSMDKLIQERSYNFVWVGLVSTQYRLTPQEEELASKVLIEKHCYPVFVTEDELKPYLRFYEGFVRPIMHNFVDPSAAQDLAYVDWQDYKNINRKIALKVQQLRNELKSDTVWIHGDQFMMLPYYIRQHDKAAAPASIGFYFHQAFPASAVFMYFFKRVHILQSLLHCDLIGFHIWEYARNFLNCCQRVLSLHYELSIGSQLSLTYHRRRVQVIIQHIGLDEKYIKEIMKGRRFEQEVKWISQAMIFQEKQNRNNNRNMRASLSRGNLNQFQSQMRQASSQPSMLTGLQTTRRESIDSTRQTQPSSINDGMSSNGTQETRQKRIVMSSIDSFHNMTGIVAKLQGYYAFLKQFSEYKDKIVLVQIIRGLFVRSDNLNGLIRNQDQQQRTFDGRSGEGEINSEGTSMRDIKKNQGLQGASYSKSTNTDGSNKRGDFWLTDIVPALKQLNTELTKLINMIHSEFGKECLLVKAGTSSTDARLALWSKSNILFVSTLKDGLYLTTFEFIWVKHLMNDFANSAMILSEFTGCNSQFAGFYEFNPFNRNTTVMALEKCLKDSDEEKAAKMRRAFKFCHKRTFTKWVDNFLKELKLAYQPDVFSDWKITFLGLQAAQDKMKEIEAKPGDIIPFNQDMVSMPAPLDIKKTALEAISSRKNLIMIEHQVLPFEQYSKSEKQPRADIISQLTDIVYDKSNIIVVLSNLSKKKVEEVFNNKLKAQENFWMAAESGYWLKSTTPRFNALFELPDKSWIKTIKKIMDEFCQNIDGSVVQERECSIMWDYTNTEGDHGAKTANQLEVELRTLIGTHSPLEILHPQGYIEVLPSKLTMQASLTNIFQKIQEFSKTQVENLLYIGSESTPDSVISFIQNQVENKHTQNKFLTTQHEENQQKTLFAEKCQSTICVVGKRPTLAKYYLESQEMQKFIAELAIKSQSQKRVKSYTNLLDNMKNQNNLNMSNQDWRNHSDFEYDDEMVFQDKLKVNRLYSGLNGIDKHFRKTGEVIQEVHNSEEESVSQFIQEDSIVRNGSMKNNTGTDQQSMVSGNPMSRHSASLIKQASSNQNMQTMINTLSGEYFPSLRDRQKSDNNLSRSPMKVQLQTIELHQNSAQTLLSPSYRPDKTKNMQMMNMSNEKVKEKEKSSNANIRKSMTEIQQKSDQQTISNSSQDGFKTSLPKEASQ